MPLPSLALTLLLVLQLAGAPAAAPPFAPGETLRYQARLGLLPIGRATARVGEPTAVRGERAWIFQLRGAGGPGALRARYELTSWTAMRDFTARRFRRLIVQPGGGEDATYEIVPDSGRYRRIGGQQDWVTPAGALDELAFLYWLRTVPLAPGRTYVVPRYFQTGWNPIRVSVTGRESITLGSGARVTCLVLRITAAGATVDAWLTDDARRLPAQLKLPLPFGRVTLVLD